MFTGIRSAITDETNVQNKTKKALEHAYLRALFESIGETHTRDVVEGNFSHINSTKREQRCIP